MSTATAQTGWVICAGTCGQGTAGKTRHRANSAIGQLCSMSSNRRSRRSGEKVENNLAHAPVGVQIDQDSYTAPDWDNSDSLDSVVEQMLSHYSEQYGEDSEPFRQTKKFRNEIDYRLKSGLKDKEPSQAFDDFANNFLHDPHLQELIMEDYNIDADDARLSIVELEGRIRHRENIAATEESNAASAQERHMHALAAEADELARKIAEFQPTIDRYNEIKAEFKPLAVEYAKDHGKEWLQVDHVQARFTPSTNLDIEKAEKVIPKNQRKALLKPEELDVKLVRGWLENNSKLDVNDYLTEGSGSYSFKVVEPKEGE